MINHLILASGYELTECRLTEVPPGDKLVKDVAEMDCRNCREALIRQGVCPECEEKGRLAWGTFQRKTTNVVDGRLTARDVVTAFYLGCEFCSETLVTEVDAETVATYLTEQRWLP